MKFLINNKYNYYESNILLITKKTKSLTKLKIIYISFIFCVFLIISPPKLLKIALCTMGKEENIYVKEFIEYYKNLGVDHIFIYDDNDYHKENFSDVINSLNYKYVSIFPSIDHSQSKSLNIRCRKQRLRLHLSVDLQWPGPQK